MKKTNTIALVGMIFSLVSITLCCTFEMIFYGISIPLGMIVAATGGICSFIGYRQSCTQTFKEPFKKLAIAGMIIGIVSFCLKLIVGLIALLGIIGINILGAQR